MVGWKCGVQRTRGKALLELVGLVGVLENKGVQEALAADLELDLLGLAVLLDPGGCRSNCLLVFNSVFRLHGLLSERKKRRNVQEASFRRQISMNCLISETSRGMVTVDAD